VRIKKDLPSTIPEFGYTLKVLDGSGRNRKYVGVSDLNNIVKISGKG